MRRLLPFLLLASFAIPTTSCVVVSKKPGHHSQAVKHKKHKKCRPSQYWDGRTCRHKGKGKGARKHDGR